MKLNSRFRAAVAAAAVIGFAFGAAPAFAGATNLVVNGDFSTPNTGGGWGEFNLAQSGWSNTDPGGTEIGNNSLYGLPCISTGCQNLEVNANQFGDVSQVVTGLTPGAEYSFTFDYGGRPGVGVEALDVLAGGTVLNATPLTGSYGVWTPETYSFTATAGSETIEFKSLITSGAGGGGNEITNVSLSAAVPEPATWAMLILGVGLIGLTARRRGESAVAAA